ncbi:MAG: hypothetical protein N2560_09385 [Ignavibacteria bacterium]|nr:hypothetical protein [Ignavibacteria bacterium]
MYCKVRDFLSDLKDESEKTLKIFKSLTNDSLSTKVYEEGRTIENIARHIIFTISDMFKYLNIQIDGICKETKLQSVQEIEENYKKAIDNLLEQIPNKLTDEDLTKEIEIYGEKWKVNYMLYAYIKHEIHHRSQITVLMRQANLKVPGVYGPSKEEWKDYGMEPEE